MSCTQGVALIAGGWDAFNYYQYVEVYSSNVHLQLPDLPVEYYGHVMEYINGDVLICSGFNSPNCLQLQLDGESAERETIMLKMT